METAPGIPDPLFLHELAIELGMTKRQLVENMSAHELCVEWPLYFRYRRGEAERQRKEQERQAKRGGRS